MFFSFGGILTHFLAPRCLLYPPYIVMKEGQLTFMIMWSQIDSRLYFVSFLVLKYLRKEKAI